MQAVMRLVPWTCAGFLAITIGCASQSQTTGLSSQKKTTPCGPQVKSCPAQLTVGKERSPAAGKATLTAQPATPAKPTGVTKPTNPPFDKQQLVARIREVAAKQAGKQTVHKTGRGTAARHSANYFARKLANMHPMPGKYLLRNLTRAARSLPYPPAPSVGYTINPTASQ